MTARFYTVVVLPGGASSPRTFHIRRTTLVALVSVMLISVGLFTLLFLQCAELGARVRDLRQVRREAGERSIVAVAVERLERQLSGARELHGELRVVAGLDKEPDGLMVTAQGGADSGSRGALRDAIRQRASGFVDWVNGELSGLAEEIVSRERGLLALRMHLDRKTATLAATPTILPVKGLMTAGYGYRTSPFTGQREFHDGMDIAAPYGTPIRATADGVVSFAGPLGTYGNVVFIDHGHGFSTAYGHNSQNRVRTRQRVRRGDVIAYVGTTGRTTGPHVHYEVYVGGATSNPLQYAVDTSGVWLADIPEKHGSS
jgi:murein DD-endopeptidase MepM/ murein hydrolase activator NlpD